MKSSDHHQADTLSYARSRLIEIGYKIQVTVSAGALTSDISVELPITIVSFLSLDPPPSQNCVDDILSSASSSLVASSTLTSGQAQLRGITMPRTGQLHERGPEIFRDALEEEIAYDYDYMKGVNASSAPNALGSLCLPEDSDEVVQHVLTSDHTGSNQYLAFSALHRNFPPEEPQDAPHDSHSKPLPTIISGNELTDFDYATPRIDTPSIEKSLLKAARTYGPFADRVQEKMHLAESISRLTCQQSDCDPALLTRLETLSEDYKQSLSLAVLGNNEWGQSSPKSLSDLASDDSEKRFTNPCDTSVSLQSHPLHSDPTHAYHDMEGPVRVTQDSVSGFSSSVTSPSSENVAPGATRGAHEVKTLQEPWNTYSPFQATFSPSLQKRLRAQTTSEDVAPAAPRDAEREQPRAKSISELTMTDSRRNPGLILLKSSIQERIRELEERMKADAHHA